LIAGSLPGHSHPFEAAHAHGGVHVQVMQRSHAEPGPLSPSDTAECGRSGRETRKEPGPAVARRDGQAPKIPGARRSSRACTGVERRCNPCPQRSLLSAPLHGPGPAPARRVAVAARCCVIRSRAGRRPGTFAPPQRRTRQRCAAEPPSSREQRSPRHFAPTVPTRFSCIETAAVPQGRWRADFAPPSTAARQECR
jgi:hypothetical protein